MCFIRKFKKLPEYRGDFVSFWYCIQEPIRVIWQKSHTSLKKNLGILLGKMFPLIPLMTQLC